jgi:2'-5' RNA ligase
MKRTFIAVKIEPGKMLLDAVEKMRLRLRNESVKWVDLNQVHVTLAFIGDTSEGTIKDISEMLAVSCKGFGEIEFRVAGVGVFKSITDPRVIWAGIGNNRRLTQLEALISGGLKELGLGLEEKPFRPHLTLARIRTLKDQKVLGTLISDYENVVFQESRISEVIYFESILQQTGPLYVPMKKVRL